MDGTLKMSYDFKDTMIWSKASTSIHPRGIIGAPCLNPPYFLFSKTAITIFRPFLQRSLTRTIVSSNFLRLRFIKGCVKINVIVSMINFKINVQTFVFQTCVYKGQLFLRLNFYYQLHIVLTMYLATKSAFFGML